MLAEVFPDTVCQSIAACAFVGHSAKTGKEGSIRVAADVEVPFPALSDKPQLRECFVTCRLPRPGLHLHAITLEAAEGGHLVTWPLEVCVCPPACTYAFTRRQPVFHAIHFLNGARLSMF